MLEHLFDINAEETDGGLFAQTKLGLMWCALSHHANRGPDFYLREQHQGWKSQKEQRMCY
jgi:hypothetical protein